MVGDSAPAKGSTALRRCSGGLFAARRDSSHTVAAGAGAGRTNPANPAERVDHGEALAAARLAIGAVPRRFQSEYTCRVGPKSVPFHFCIE